MRDEIKKWEFGNEFDEFTIHLYVQEMLRLAKKHNVDLGIDVGKDVVEEIPTTYATELEVLEEKVNE